MAKLRRVRGSSYWYVEGRDGDGYRYLQTTKQKNKVAAARVAARIEVERAVPRVRPYALSEALSALYDHKVLSCVSKSELEIVSTKGARLLEHFGAEKDVNDFARQEAVQEIEGYVKVRRTHRVGTKTAKTVSDATIRKELGKLFEALRLARRDGKFRGDVESLRTKVLQRSKPKTAVATPEQFVALWRCVPLSRRPYLLVSFHVGARHGEMKRLEACHIDHGRIVDGRRVGMKLWVIGKKGREEYRERWVPLSQAAYDVLVDLAEQHPKGPLFPKPWHPSNIKRTVGLACRKVGIPEMTANDFRRSFVTWQGMFGTSDTETKKLVGHSPNSKMVESVYRQLHENSGRVATDQFPTPAPDDGPEDLDNVVAISQRRGASSPA